MAVELQDNQWELGGLVFGKGCRIAHEPTVAPPGMARRKEDQQIPGRDGMSPGIDLFDPSEWKFQLYTDTHDQTDALLALSEIANVWRGDEYRQAPGQATSLRYRIGGRTRAVYGRPDLFDYTLGAEYLSGRIPITCTFQTVSELYFDDAEESMEVRHREPPSATLTWPITWPTTWSGETLSGLPYQFDVHGIEPTPVLIDFYGPLEGSGMLIDGKPFIDFQSNIPGGVKVTVDARPWVTSVWRSDGASAAGLLSPRSRMPQMLLSPGRHSATLLGTSSNGNGTALIRWQPANPSI